MSSREGLVETKMKKIAIVAIGLAAVAISACAPRYYDDRYGYNRGYHDRYYGYSDRYDRDRDGVPNRYDRDRDNDGVPNYTDRRPDNPYRY